MQKANLLEQYLACPKCRAKLDHKSDGLRCTANPEHVYPIVRGIPRFVDQDHYVGSFSFEWLTHSKTQLDTFSGSQSSEEQLIQKTGFHPEDLKDRLVLDAGVGAGRYSDVMSRWGARVIGVDLSYAVESSYKNFKHLPNVLIAQADIGRLPFKPATFDAIVSIGVLHHTPDTKTYFNHLLAFLKPGGTIAIWVYPKTPSYIIRNEWIPYTSRIPIKMFYEWCRWFVPYASRHPNSRAVELVRRAFPFSEQGLGLENDILDTFDGYSPRYHGIHSPEEVTAWFREAGLTRVSCPSDWQTCVRGTLPT